MSNGEYRPLVPPSYTVPEWKINCGLMHAMTPDELALSRLLALVPEGQEAVRQAIRNLWCEGNLHSIVAVLALCASKE